MTTASRSINFAVWIRVFLTRGLSASEALASGAQTKTDIFMKGHKEVRISYWAAHATTIVSVTLVLLLVGIIAVISSAAGSETRRMREKIELSAIMADTVSDLQAAPALEAIKRMPSTRQAVLVTKRQAMEQWKEETGEDLEKLLGVNPLSPEISFSLQARYANPDSIVVIGQRVAAIPGVVEVAAPDASMVESMNRNIGTLSVILGGIAVVMLIISFVLINNTVHLTIYSRRFTIHTMQLVGATSGFIRRPIIWRNMLAGLVAGLIASGVIAVALLFVPAGDYLDAGILVSWPVYGIIAAGLVIIGAVICALAAWIATARYLNKDYGELFK